MEFKWSLKVALSNSFKKYQPQYTPILDNFSGPDYLILGGGEGGGRRLILGASDYLGLRRGVQALGCALESEE